MKLSIYNMDMDGTTCKNIISCAIDLSLCIIVVLWTIQNRDEITQWEQFSHLVLARSTDLMFIGFQLTSVSWHARNHIDRDNNR